MRKMNAKFNTVFLSEAGALLKNQDYFAFVELDDYACYVIADGIDDEAEGESAKIAVSSLIRQFSEKPSMQRSDLRRWLLQTNQELLQQSKIMRLKASVSIVVTDYTSLVYGMAGNTRVAVYREGMLFHESFDNSLSKKMVEEGKLPIDKLAAHLERHNLYCYLGQPEGCSPVISSRLKLENGDSLCLYSRGIWENVDSGEIGDAVQMAQSPQDVLDHVEDLLLSRQPKQLDNYTLATIFVDKVYQDPNSRREKIRRILMIAVPLLILLLLVGSFFYIRNQRINDQKEAMAVCIASGKAMLEENNYVRAGEEYKTALDIARKLKLPNEEKDLANYYKTIGLIIAGDTALQQRDFATANEKYRAALAASYFADQLGETYIRRQLRNSSEYMTVTELLQSGDQKAEAKDLLGARQAYLEAKVIATRIYYTDGRKEAAEKLAKLGEQLNEDGKKAKEQEAFAFEQQGNRLAQSGDYEGAVSMMSIAAGLYDQGGKGDKASAVQRKIVSMEDHLTAAQKSELQNKLAEEAEGYEREGDRLAADGASGGAALEQYGLAMNLYNRSGNRDKVALLQKKMDNLNERKNNADKLSVQRQAMELERTGDTQAAQGQFDDARNSYLAAQDLYGGAGLSTNVSAVQRKIDSLEQKGTSFEQQKSKAAGYVSEADQRVQQGDYTRARYLYLLALDGYDKLGLKREKDVVTEKLKLLDRLEKGK